MPVIDASVAIKWFVEEPDSPAAHQLLDAHATGERTLVAPDLLIYEVSNVLLRNRTFSVVEVQRSVERLYELEVDLIAPTREVVTAAIDVAAAHHLTFYDALYVQLARHLALPLYTADRKLISKLPDFSFLRGLSPTS